MGRDRPAAAVGSREEETDEALRALAEPRRRAILQLVAHSELSAGEIASCFDVTRTAVSQHLTVLKNAGLLTERRLATRRLYRARPEGLAGLREFLDQMVQIIRNWTIREWNEALVPERPWRDIQPDLSAEPYVFTTGEPPPGVSPFAVIREDEGVTVILTRAVADRLGLAYDYVAARITLRVNSTLTDVGLTALFSRTLAESGISCNVIAGLAHDHLFVDWDQAARALALLREL